MRTIAIIYTFLTLAFATANAQTVEIGLMGGVSLYNGDLSPIDYAKYLDDIRPAGGFFIRNNFHSKFSIRGSLTIGQLHGDDRGDINDMRGLYFKSPIIEVGLIGEIHPLRKWQNYTRTNSRVSPYVFGGIAGFYFNPKTDYQGQTVELQPLGTEGQGLPGFPEKYNRVQVSIPLGFGISFDLNDQVKIGVEFGGRKLFTDYIDDVGSQELNYFTLVSGNGAIAGELSIRNPDQRPTELTDNVYRRGSDLKDWYYFGGITVGVKLQGGNWGGIGCPTY